MKADATAKAQAVMPDVVFGSNTSTLPITSLAETAKDPAKFIGIHFFSPVERMMLVEIIVGKKTGDAALATALDYVRAIRKTPIVVNDTRGFYANRCVLNYIQEGHLMLLEGIPAAMIENTGAHGRHAGRPALAQRRDCARSRPQDRAAPRKPISGPRPSIRRRRNCWRPWSRSTAGSAARTARASTTIRRSSRSGSGRGSPTCSRRSSSRDKIEALDVEELKQRFLVVQAVEAARTFEEGVVTDVREADVGSILGFGFAPFSGGTLSYIDMMGVKKFVELCKRLEKKHGARFAPPKLLLEMAKNGDSFYSRFAPGRKAA